MASYIVEMDAGVHADATAAATAITNAGASVTTTFDLNMTYQIDCTADQLAAMSGVKYSSLADANSGLELSVLNTPFIAVPLPTSKDNHQLENAVYYKNFDCCWIVEQNYFNEKIEDLLNDIIVNKKDCLKKKENLKKLNYQNTWINANQKILKIINEN